MNELTGREIALAAVKAATERKAENITLLNPGTSSGIAEWFIVCGGDNTNHNQAIADQVIEVMRDLDIPRMHREGYEEGRWILLDYFDVIINIMLPELRSHYNIEKLWGDECPTEQF